LLQEQVKNLMSGGGGGGGDDGKTVECGTDCLDLRRKYPG